jgi:hypothetical protein
MGGERGRGVKEGRGGWYGERERGGKKGRETLGINSE